MIDHNVRQFSTWTPYKCLSRDNKQYNSNCKNIIINRRYTGTCEFAIHNGVPLHIRQCCSQIRMYNNRVERHIPLSMNVFVLRVCCETTIILLLPPLLYNHNWHLHFYHYNLFHMPNTKSKYSVKDVCVCVSDHLAWCLSGFLSYSKGNRTWRIA